jgi:hypothetical protein
MPPKDPRREDGKPPATEERISTHFGKVMVPRPADPEDTRPENPRAHKLKDMGKPGGPPLLVPEHTARRAQTMRGLPAPPPQGTPGPPRTLSPPEFPAVEEPPPESIHIPAPWDENGERKTLEREVARRGGRIAHAPVSTPLPAPSVVPSSVPPGGGKALMQKLALIAGACTGIGGVITAGGNAAVQVIEAQRPPSLAALRERIEALEQAQAAGNGMQLEAKARRAGDEELAEELRKLKAQLRALEGEPRVQTVQGLQPPK